MLDLERFLLIFLLSGTSKSVFDSYNSSFFVTIKSMVVSIKNCKSGILSNSRRSKELAISDRYNS